MAQFDISQVARDFSKEAREQRIHAYREFYETNLESIDVWEFRKNIMAYLLLLRRQPESQFDQEFSSLNGHINNFVETKFGKTLLQWYQEDISAVVEIKKSDPMHIFRLNELSWLHHKAKLSELLDCLESNGLHPDIDKRDLAAYARYNVIIEHHPAGAKKLKKECKQLMSLAELDRQVLLPQRSQKPLQLNGKFFPVADINRFTITQTLLLDPEVRLYKQRYGCYNELDFCNHFPDLTDKLIHNPHLDEARSETPKFFVDPARIDAFKAYTGTAWDMRKLIQLCEELNVNFQVGNFYSVVYLSRALIDHIPPILGCNSFDEVANNYAGDRSFKKATEQLSKTMKHIADLHIHKQIAPSLSIPNMTQVDFSQSMDFLLGELLTKL